MPNSKVIECVICYSRYSLNDCASGLYRLETLVCSPCYARMQQDANSCFGKACEAVSEEERTADGYDPASKECSWLCPDRVVCAKILDPPGIIILE